MSWCGAGPCESPARPAVTRRLGTVRRASIAAKNFLSILAQLEKSYGGFSPVNPQRKRVDTDTPPTSLEWRAQGASHYQFAVVSYEDEYAFVWKARRTVAGNFVDVAGTWASKPDDPSAPCITDIDYQGK